MSTTFVTTPQTPLTKAIDTLVALLNSNDDKVRLEAAKALLEKRT